MRTPVPSIGVVCVVLAAGWLLLFAHSGILAQFSGDDLMNLHGYAGRSPLQLIGDNLRYWSTAYRPLGGLFYVALYRCFGFDPLPFRVACFGLLAANLGLLWRFALRLSDSREAAFLTLLLAAYHAWFVDLYYSTGTVYDLLCYAFYLGAFNLYLGVRGENHELKPRHLAALAVLYVCALNAKEMAVTLPVLLTAYEAIYHGRVLSRGAMLTGALTVPYVVTKLTGAGSLTENPAYRLTVSPGRYLDTFHLYLNPLLYQDHVFRDANTVQLLACMLGIALLRRSRPLMFGWCFVLISLLPVAFIAHYSAFFLYLPMAGWSLYAAVLLEGARRLLVRRLARLAGAGGDEERRLRRVSAIAVPVALCLILGPLHDRESRKTLAAFERAQPPSRIVAGEMLAMRPGMRRGARVLFVDSPFTGNDRYFLLFLTRLLYGDPTITVEQASGTPKCLDYDAVFTFRNGHLADDGRRASAATRW